MSHTERRHFHQTVRGGKDSKYVQLFNAIANQKEYSEQKLIKKFEYSDNHNSFSVAKNHLFKLVLKSLREFSSHFGDYQSLLQLLKNIEILEFRGLRQEAQKNLEKAKKIALRNNWGSFLLVTEHWEQRLFTWGQPINPPIPSLGEALDTELQYEHLYKRIYYDNLLYGYDNHTNSGHCYMEIIGHPLMQSFNTPSCELSRWYFCLIKIECNRSIVNTPGILQWAEELLIHQKGMSANGFYDAGWQIQGMCEYLHALLDNNQIERFQQAFHLIKDLKIPAHRTDLLRQRERDTLLLESYLFVICNGCESTLEQLVEKITAYVKDLKKQTIHANDLMLILAVQYLYYSTRQNDKAVEWGTMFERFADRDLYITYYTGSKIFSILSHYALQNYTYVKNVIPTLERYIIKHNRLNSEFAFLFRLLKNLLKATTKKEKQALLNNFKADMKMLQKTNTKRKYHLLSAYSLMFWADNCLSKDSMLNINKQTFFRPVFE